MNEIMDDSCFCPNEYNYVDVELEQIKEKLDIVLCTTNKKLFWKTNITYSTVDWRTNCVSFVYKDSSIIKVNLHEYTQKYSKILDKEVQTVLVKQFEQTLFEDSKKQIKKKHIQRQKLGVVAPWERKLYRYIDKTCK